VIGAAVKRSNSASKHEAQKIAAANAESGTIRMVCCDPIEVGPDQRKGEEDRVCRKTLAQSQPPYTNQRALAIKQKKQRERPPRSGALLTRHLHFDLRKAFDAGLAHFRSTIARCRDEWPWGALGMTRIISHRGISGINIRIKTPQTEDRRPVQVGDAASQDRIDHRRIEPQTIALTAPIAAADPKAAVDNKWSVHRGVNARAPFLDRPN